MHNSHDCGISWPHKRNILWPQNIFNCGLNVTSVALFSMFLSVFLVCSASLEFLYFADGHKSNMGIKDEIWDDLLFWKLGSRGNRKDGKALVPLTQRFTAVDTQGHGGDSKADDAYRSVVEEVG